MLKRSVLAVVLSLAIGSLSSCGGGGGSSGNTQISGSTVPPSGGSATDNASANQNVRAGLLFNSINLGYKTTYAQLGASNDASANVWLEWLGRRQSEIFALVSNILAPSAVAQTSGLRQIDSSEASEISKLFFDAELQAIESTVTVVELDENDNPVMDENGNPKEIEIDCDLSGVEINVVEVRRLNLLDESLIAEVLLPTVLDADCKAVFSSRTIVINDQKSVFDVTDEFQLGSVVTLIAAKDLSFNDSEEAIIDFGDGVLRGLRFENNTVVIEELTATGVEINTQGRGAFIYDGTNLIVSQRNSGETLTLVSFERGSTEFEFFRPYPNEYESGYKLVLGAEGEKILIEEGRVRYLNWEEKSVLGLGLNMPFEPNTLNSAHPCFGAIYATDSNESYPVECLYLGQDNWLYGGRFFGRYGDWLIDERNGAYNYKTGEVSGNIHCLPTVTASCWMWADFFDQLDNRLYVVSNDRSRFIRFEIGTRDYSLINLDDFGYLADSDYYITPDDAFVNIANSANSNKEFIQINYDSGTVTNLGVISEGSRDVKRFYTPSG